MALLKAFKLLNLVSTLRKISRFIDQVEAITTLFEHISKIIQKEAKENNKLLNISAEKLDKIEKAVKKIERFDKKIERIQASLK